jgi:hypothetical protein
MPDIPLPNIPGIQESFAQDGGSPVKTRVLRAIVETIEAVVGANQVVARPQVPVDKDTATYPLVYVFDEPETVRPNNRYAEVTMPIQMEIWLKDGDFTISEQADWIQALLHERFTNSNETFKAVALTLMPAAQDSAGPKFYWDESLGGTTLRYVAKYMHLWGNPYLTGK